MLLIAAKDWYLLERAVILGHLPSIRASKCFGTNTYRVAKANDWQPPIRHHPTHGAEGNVQDFRNFGGGEEWRSWATGSGSVGLRCGSLRRHRRHSLELNCLAAWRASRRASAIRVSRPRRVDARSRPPSTSSRTGGVGAGDLSREHFIFNLRPLTTGAPA
jgi:hypothetical protein